MCGDGMNVFKSAGAVARNNGMPLADFRALAGKHKNMVEAKYYVAQAVGIDIGAAPLLEEQKKRIAASETAVREKAKKVSGSIPEEDYKALRLGAKMPAWALFYGALLTEMLAVGAMLIGFAAYKMNLAKNAEYDMKKALQLTVIALGLTLVGVIASAIRDQTAVGKAADAAKEAKRIANGGRIAVDGSRENGL
jgi:hypothetical protein